MLNSKICLKLAGLHEILVFLVCVVSFEGKSPLNKCLNFDGLSRQETIWQLFPMNSYNDWLRSLFYLQPIFFKSVYFQHVLQPMSPISIFPQKPSSTQSNLTCGVFIYALSLLKKQKIAFYDKCNSLHSCFLLPFFRSSLTHCRLQINPPLGH